MLWDCCCSRAARFELHTTFENNGETTLRLKVPWRSQKRTPRSWDVLPDVPSIGFLINLWPASDQDDLFVSPTAGPRHWYRRRSGSYSCDTRNRKVKKRHSSAGRMWPRNGLKTLLIRELLRVEWLSKRSQNVIISCWDFFAASKEKYSVENKGCPHCTAFHHQVSHQEAPVHSVRSRCMPAYCIPSFGFSKTESHRDLGYWRGSLREHLKQHIRISDPKRGWCIAPMLAGKRAVHSIHSCITVGPSSFSSCNWYELCSRTNTSLQDNTWINKYI